MSRAQAEVAETFRLFHSLLEERKTEVLRELEATFSSKQVAMAICTQRTQEAVEKIYNVSQILQIFNATQYILIVCIMGIHPTLGKSPV